MDFNYDEKTDTTNLTAYKDLDICCKCPKIIRNNCPLLHCLKDNYVYPSAQKLIMSDCSLYNLIKDSPNLEDKEEKDNDETES